LDKKNNSLKNIKWSSIRKQTIEVTFYLLLFFVTDKIKQHVLFLTSGNSDEYFYLWRDARGSREVRSAPLEMAFQETAKNKTIQGKNIFWTLLH